MGRRHEDERRLAEAEQRAAEAHAAWHAAMAAAATMQHPAPEDEQRLFDLWREREQTRRDLLATQAWVARRAKRIQLPHWLRRTR